MDRSIYKDLRQWLISYFEPIVQCYLKESSYESISKNLHYYHLHDSRTPSTTLRCQFTLLDLVSHIRIEQRLRAIIHKILNEHST